MADFSGQPGADPFLDWYNGTQTTAPSNPLSVGLDEYGTLSGADAAPAQPTDVPPVPVTAPMAMPVSGPPGGYSPLTQFVPVPHPVAVPVPVPAKKSEAKAAPAPAPTPAPASVNDALAGIAQPGTAEPWPPPHWDMNSLAGAYAPMFGGDAQPAPLGTPAPGSGPALGEPQPTPAPQGELGFLPPGQDPWANTQPDVAGALGGIAQPVQPGTDDAVARHQGEQLANDPYALALDNKRIAEDRRNKMADDMIAANRKAQAQLEQDQAAQQAARAKTNAQMTQLQADAKALADGGYGWAKMSTGQKMLSLFSVFAGGLHASLKMNNGQNVGAQIVQKNIEEDLQARQQGINMRRQLLGEQVQNDQMDAHQMEAHRLASYETAIRGLQAEWMKYDPAGTAANNYANTIAGLRQMQTQSMLQYQGQLDKHNETQAKIQLDQANALKAMAEIGKINAKGAGGAGGMLGSGGPINRVTLRKLYPDIPENELPAPGVSFNTNKEYEQWLETRKKAFETSGVRTGGQSKEDLDRTIVLPDGTKFIANGDSAGLNELRKASAATTTAVRAIDEMVRMRNDSGWTSDTLKSGAWRRQKEKYGVAISQMKELLGLGRMTEFELEHLFPDIMGTKDPTEARDPTAGLRAARESMIDIMRDKAFSFGGPHQVNLPEVKLGAPSVSDIDSLDKAITQAGELAGNSMVPGDQRADLWRQMQQLQVIRAEEERKRLEAESKK